MECVDNYLDVIPIVAEQGLQCLESVLRQREVIVIQGRRQNLLLNICISRAHVGEVLQLFHIHVVRQQELPPLRQVLDLVVDSGRREVFSIILPWAVQVAVLLANIEKPLLRALVDVF